MHDTNALPVETSHLYPRLAFTVLALLIVLFAAAFRPFVQKRTAWPKDAPEYTPQAWPLLGGLGFLTARWDFLRKAAAASPSGQYSFNIGAYRVVGLSGEQGRRTFFESKQLSLSEGYAALFAGAPTPPDVLDAATMSKGDANSSSSTPYFSKRLIRLVQRDRLERSLPQITSDTYAALTALKNSNTNLTDPFDSIYRLVYQLTMRTVGCTDIASSPALLSKTLSWYNLIENASSATTILFPRFPGLAYLQRTYGGARLYMLLKSIVDGRAKKKSDGDDKIEDDPLQFLIDSGDSMMQIISFIMGALFAGLLNSGINAGYILAYLGASPKWQTLVRQEVTSVVDKYSPPPDDDDKTKSTLAARLSHVPLSAWESEFPLLELCLRDSVRLQTNGAGFRLNTSSRPVPIGDTGLVIPPAAYATYPLDDIHMDASVYENPGEWDPARYMAPPPPPQSEDKAAAGGGGSLAYVGWGAGRHPCLGMKFAKLENNVIAAYFVAMFEWELCDERGRKVASPPRSDRQSWSANKPRPGCRLRFRARE